jgi:hypothetical protein
VKVSAAFRAPRRLSPLQAGPKVHEVKLEPGVTVTGVVLKDGKPLAGIALGLVQKDRNVERFLGEFTIATDEKGQFRFQNVGPDELYFVYGLMDSCRPHGAISVRQVGVGASGTETDLGSLAIQPGHRLSGRLTLSDGKPVNQGTRVLVSREEAWDSQTALVAADGSFAFSGLPTESFSLTVSVPRYHVSPKNGSFNLLTYGGLVGRVSGDTDGLRVLLEPGPRPRPDYKDSKKRDSDYKEYKRRSEAPLRGVRERPLPKEKKSGSAISRHPDREGHPRYADPFAMPGQTS